MSRYRWAWRPAWILSHVFVLVCVVLFVRLGLWQVARLDERRTHNALVEARQTAPATPIEGIVPPHATSTEVESTIFRRTTLVGVFRSDEQVLIRNQTQRSSPGYHVVTPLVLADGRAVAVNRGWVPLTVGDADPAAFAAPAGTVTVTGVVAATQTREGIGVADPEGERVRALARVDVGRLQQQVAETLLPVYVVSESQEPAAGTLPVTIEPPALDDGPHLNYAGQWFIFAALTCIVYPLLLRRTARNRVVSDDDGDDLAGGGGPGTDDVDDAVAVDAFPAGEPAASGVKGRRTVGDGG